MFFFTVQSTLEAASGGQVLVDGQRGYATAAAHVDRQTGRPTGHYHDGASSGPELSRYHAAGRFDYFRFIRRTDRGCVQAARAQEMDPFSLAIKGIRTGVYCLYRPFRSL
jgi:hypothetical protein